MRKEAKSHNIQLIEMALNCPETVLIFPEMGRRETLVTYTFGDYSLDPARRELRQSHEVVPVEPQVFDILECLVRNHQRIVSKDDLIAEVWGRRIVSDSTITSRMTAARHAIGDSGKEQRFIQRVSRRGFRFVGAVQELQEGAKPFADLNDAKSGHSPPERTAKPVIAILPFAGHSSAEELAYGIIEDIITGLTQYRWLSVIARSMSCAHKGWTLDIRKIGRELGAHYVLEGSVRRIEGRMRVTSRLIDAADGTQLWAGRFDSAATGLFDNQDQITTNVIGAVGSKLERLEIERVHHNRAESLNSNQIYLRGMGHLYQWDKDSIDDALVSFRKAIALDPDFAPAYGMAAYCYVQRQSYGWHSDRSQESAECARLAQTAAALATDDPITLARAAHAISAVVGHLDEGAILIEQALRLNPSLSAAWYVSAWINLFLGSPKVAMEHAGRAISLNPYDPLAFKTRAAFAYSHFFAGRYDEAAAIALNALNARPGYLTAMRCAAASHALGGRLEVAQGLIADMHDRDPKLRISNLLTLLPFSRQQDFARWTDGLQKAGLPD